LGISVAILFGLAWLIEWGARRAGRRPDVRLFWAFWWPTAVLAASKVIFFLLLLVGVLGPRWRAYPWWTYLGSLLVLVGVMAALFVWADEHLGPKSEAVRRRIQDIDWLHSDELAIRVDQFRFTDADTRKVPRGIVALNMAGGDIVEAGRLLRPCEAVVARESWGMPPLRLYVCAAGRRSLVDVRAVVSLPSGTLSQATPGKRLQCMRAYEDMLCSRESLTVENAVGILGPCVAAGLEQWVSGQPDERRVEETVRDAILLNRPSWREFSLNVSVRGDLLQQGAESACAVSPMARVGYRADGAVYRFEIDRFPVTNAEYAEFLDHLKANPETSTEYSCKGRVMDHEPDGWSESNREKLGDHPVVGVDWYDAYSYARWKGKRLPSSEEWEYAAGWSEVFGTRQRYPWKGDFDAKKCNCFSTPGIEAFPTTTPVGMFFDGISPRGCFDMAGNVLEWCATRAGRGWRVLKGGCWAKMHTEVGDDVAIAANYEREAVERRPYYGFRCARDAR